ncbi:MAG: c-type cytochrome, partial [Anaerolineae bacterium]
ACGRSQVQKPAAQQPQAQVEQPKESASDVSTKQAEPEQAAEAEHHEGDEHPEAEHEEAEVEHHEGDEHPEAEHEEAGHGHGPEEHMGGHHDVPEEAAAVENPIPATEESVVAGATIFAQNCAVCHGETGEGDGPAAAALEEKPANLHEDHVQELSDGALFWIISHGVAKSPMPPWDNILTEDERWHVVNFVRTFNEGQ